jgi:hypothetical protein
MAKPLVGLSGPFSRRANAHCPRCAQDVEATFPWPYWGRVRKVWFTIAAGIVMASPVLMSDVYGMLPSAMVFVTAIGPLNALARICPTCLQCGCVVEAVQGKAAKTHG